MESGAAPVEADTEPGITPHPLWLGLILLFGGLLAGAGGQWGLAALFLAFSGALFVGGGVEWWQSRRRQGVADGP